MQYRPGSKGSSPYAVLQSQHPPSFFFLALHRTVWRNHVKSLSGGRALGDLLEKIALKSTINQDVITAISVGK